MTELHVRALLAGLFFGIWPLLMNRSGLTGNVSSGAFAFGVLVLVLPFTLHEFANIPVIRGDWKVVVGASVCGAVGVLLFNGLLSKTTPQMVSSLFILMLVVQIVTPALYDVVVNGRLTIPKGVGFAAAILAALLLALPYKPSSL